MIMLYLLNLLMEDIFVQIVLVIYLVLLVFVVEVFLLKKVQLVWMGINMMVMNVFQ